MWDTHTYLALLDMCILYCVPHTVGYVCPVMWDSCALYSGIHVPLTVVHRYHCTVRYTE